MGCSGYLVWQEQKSQLPIAKGSEMKIVSPVGKRDERAFVLAPRLPDLNGKFVIFLDNSHHNVDVVMERLAQRLEERFGSSVEHARKKSANSPAEGERLEEIAQKADAVINGVAD